MSQAIDLHATIESSQARTLVLLDSYPRRDAAFKGDAHASPIMPLRRTGTQLSSFFASQSKLGIARQRRA